MLDLCSHKFYFYVWFDSESVHRLACELANEVAKNSHPDRPVGPAVLLLVPGSPVSQTPRLPLTPTPSTPLGAFKKQLVSAWRRSRALMFAQNACETAESCDCWRGEEGDLWCWPAAASPVCCSWRTTFSRPWTHTHAHTQKQCVARALTHWCVKGFRDQT